IIGAFLALNLAAIGCSSDATDSGNHATDNTPAEPSLQSRIDSVANDACDVYEKCNEYGAGQRYATREACVGDFQTKATDFWPKNRCGNGQINETRYDACAQSAQDLACDNGLSESFAALTDCSADKVCTDPAQ
ncbi:MAG: DUF6184 family natural product biosynthesis lipoprotein, partial [Pseudomonadota bacterium]